MTNDGLPRALTKNSALFLDFDGTLAPLQDDPDAVMLPPDGAGLLEQLSSALGGALALVSGRDVRDLSQRVPTTLWRAGNHGDAIISPGCDPDDNLSAPPDALIKAAQQVVDSLDGVRMERKARVLAIHTRHAPQHADRVAQALHQLVAQHTDYKLQQGKDVAELKPVGVHKGVAIDRLMGNPPFEGRVPIFIGDDTTDEDGFRACLRRDGGAIKVGDGQTIAPYRLANPGAVWDFLKDGYHDIT